ncbi:methionine biosynthesis protein MetW [Magnetococcales bacterium HHB-1]
MIIDQPPPLRADHQIIADLIEPKSRILDLGCGDGTLLEYLIQYKEAQGLGIEISSDSVRQCLNRGIPIFQGNIDKGLEHNDNAFDYVILSFTLQATRKPRFVIEEMLRVGTKIIVSFPNFGHWLIRSKLLLKGRMPKTRFLPYNWYDSPNVHMCTLLDFRDLCHNMNITILRQIPLTSAGTPPQHFLKRRLFSERLPNSLANLLAPTAVFLLGKE